MTPVGHMQYIHILTWLPGIKDKIANFKVLFCPPIQNRDLDTKKAQPNINVSQEGLGTMLIYWYIERGLLLYAKSTYETPEVYIHF